jgi:hypothetical protein
LAPLDLVHEILIVRMHHQRQAGLTHSFETFEELAVIVDADPGHMGIIAPGVFDHKYFKCQRPFFGERGNLLREGA